MLKVSKERNQSRTRKTNNLTRDNYYDNYFSELNYDTIDLNDAYDYDTKYDVDFAYDEYNAFDEQQRRYVEPATEPRYSSFREYAKEDGKIRSEKKKRKMSNSMKALVVVYFAIVAVIATLLIINALPMMSTNTEIGATGFENVESVEVEANTLDNVKLADGTIVTVAGAEAVPYEYKINSNWFDNMCDWMENMAA